MFFLVYQLFIYTLIINYFIYRMKNVICVCLCLLLLGSCSDKQGELGYPVLKVSLNEQDVSVKDLFSRLEVIPLETNDSSLLVFPDKVLCRNGRYEVFDHRRYALFLFDENGRFIRQVGRRGQGLGEYREVYDVAHDSRNGNICLLSPFWEMFVYDSEGRFLERLPLPEKSNYQAVMDYGDYFVTWTIPITDEEYGISVISKDSLQCVREYWHGNRNTMFLFPRGFYQFGDDLFFSRPFQREVYRMDLNGMQVAYRWDFGNDNYSIEDFGVSLKERGDREESDNIVKLLQESVIPYCIADNRQIGKYYYAMIVYGFTPIGRKHLFYRKSDGKSFFFRQTTEGVILNPMYFCDDFLLSLASYEDMEVYKHVLDEQEFAKLANRTEEDNPFLVKCYFK